MTDIEERIAELEAVNEIKILKARYCEIADSNTTSRDMPGIFTEDGIWEAEGYGQYIGTDRVRQFFEESEARMTWSRHMAINPVIEVDGDTATGRWYFFGMFTFVDGRRIWMTNNYTETYQKTEDGWKIRHLKAPAPVVGPYEEGWPLDIQGSDAID